MEIKEVLVTEFAKNDLREILEYYQSSSQKYVEKVISDFQENILSLKKYPKSGRIVPELERQGIENYWDLIQENYRIIYEISGEIVIVHTIIDGRRNFEDIIISKLTREYNK